MNLLWSLAQLALSAVLVGLSAAVGLRFERWTGYSPGNPVERFCVGVALGAGAIASVLMLMGLAGVLSGVSCWVVLAAAGLFAAREAAGLPGLVRGAAARVRRRAGVVSVMAFVSILLVTAVVAGAPPADWDSLAYHLPVPRFWLESGRIALPPDNVHAAFVGLQQVLYLPTLAMGAEEAPALLSTLFAALLGLTAFAMSDRLFGRDTAALALPLVFSSPVLVLVAMTARVDTTLAFYLLLGHHLVLVAWRTGNRRALLVAAAVLGFSVGVKQLALLYVAALAPVMFWLVWRDAAEGPAAGSGSSGSGGARGVRAAGASGAARGVRLARGVGAARRGLLVACVALAAAGPWLLKNVALFGAPLYPEMATRHLEPWLRPLLGSVTVPAHVPAELFELNFAFRVRINLLDAFFNPGSVSDENEAVFYVPSLLLFLLPLWLLRWRRRDLVMLGGPALLFGAAAIVIESGYVNSRYLIPALVALTLVALALVTDVLAGKVGYGRILAVALGFLALAPLGVAARAQLDAYPLRWYYRSSDTAPHEYLQRSRWTMDEKLGDVLEYVNHTLPEDSRVLLLFEPRDYYFEREVLGGSNIHTNWSLLARSDPRPPCPDRFGVTHVLVLEGLAEDLAAHPRIRDEVLQWRAFSEYRKRCLGLLYENDSHRVYRVGADSGRAAGPRGSTE